MYTGQCLFNMNTVLRAYTLKKAILFAIIFYYRYLDIFLTIYNEKADVFLKL